MAEPEFPREVWVCRHTDKSGRVYVELHETEAAKDAYMEVVATECNPRAERFVSAEAVEQACAVTAVAGRGREAPVVPTERDALLLRNLEFDFALEHDLESDPDARSALGSMVKAAFDAGVLAAEAGNAQAEGWTKNPRYEPKTLEQKLGYLVEECGEVMAAAGKSIRWGLDSCNPELPTHAQETNQQWLWREMGDLEQAIRLLRAALLPPPPASQLPAGESGPHPLDVAVARVRGWAYTDSLLDLDKGKLRELLAADVEATGTALPNETESMELICGPMSEERERPCNDGNIPLDLIERFPATHAWLEEQ